LIQALWEINTLLISETSRKLCPDYFYLASEQHNHTIWKRKLFYFEKSRNDMIWYKRKKCQRYHNKYILKTKIRLARERCRLHHLNHRIIAFWWHKWDVFGFKRWQIRTKTRTKYVYQSVDSVRWKPRVLATWFKHFGILITDRQSKKLVFLYGKTHVSYIFHIKKTQCFTIDSGGKNFARYSANPAEGSFRLWRSSFLYFSVWHCLFEGQSCEFFEIKCILWFLISSNK
jgi:hypothetical protein